MEDFFAKYQDSNLQIVEDSKSSSILSMKDREINHKLAMDMLHGLEKSIPEEVNTIKVLKNCVDQFWDVDTTGLLVKLAHDLIGAYFESEGEEEQLEEAGIIRQMFVIRKRKKVKRGIRVGGGRTRLTSKQRRGRRIAARKNKRNWSQHHSKRVRKFRRALRRRDQLIPRAQQARGARFRRMHRPLIRHVLGSASRR